MRKQLEKDVNDLFDAQTLALHDNLHKTQEYHNKTRRINEMDTVNMNKKMA